MDKGSKGAGVTIASMVLSVIMTLVIAVLVMMQCSCQSHRQVIKETDTIGVPMIEVRTEVVHEIERVHDSIYVHDSVSVMAKNDTVYVNRWSTKYVERLKLDTISIQVRDTVPVPTPVIKQKVVKIGEKASEKYSLWGWLAVGAIALVGTWIIYIIMYRK